MTLKIVSVLRAALLATSIVVPSAQGASLPILKGIGGEFKAQSTLGHEISLSELNDRPLLLFFGYTNCADICPTTLGHLSRLTQGEGSLDDRVRVLFVTVDPENDDLAHLRAYLHYFDPSYIGVSDTRQRIDKIVQLFQARYRRLANQKVTTAYKKFKVLPKNGSSIKTSYLYSHSATIYLLDQEGRVRATYFNGTPISRMKEDIESLSEH